MKKIVIGIILFITLTISVACRSDENTMVTLDDMRVSLTNAGYTIIGDFEHPVDNLIDSFAFILPGAHGNVETFVFEFKDVESTYAYADYINESGNGDWVAIINGMFLTIAHAHNGVPHANEQRFLENLLSGRTID